MGEDDHKKEDVENVKPLPKVLFTTDMQQDIAKLKTFLKSDRRRGRADMKHIVMSAHPGLTEENVDSYVEDYYNNHKVEIEAAVVGISNQWEAYSPEFFEALEDIFQGACWPSGKYVGNVSISPPFPRFLHTKTFQVPYDSQRRAIRIAAHEMTHFLFYEYVRRRYTPELSNTIEKEMEEKLEGKFRIPLWEMSEIFNLVILSDERFGMGRAKCETSAYTDLAQYAGEFEEVWKEVDGNIDEFFSRMELTNDT